MMLSIQELIKLYNVSESRLEKANLWSHIEECEKYNVDIKKRIY